jgi:gluconate 2-dehydrogenase gamma chain
MNDEWVVSRREWLKRVGAAAIVPPKSLLPLVSPTGGPTPALAQTAGPATGGALETLTAAEAEILSAVAARLIPTDSNGPGATEARAAQYIDRALGGALASSRETYRAGLAALERYAHSTKGGPFARLSADDQDALLRDLERNAATGFSTGASAFFNLVLAHTIQGTFCDPYYGGNTNFVGWDLIGYPGVRLAVTAGEQGLNARPAPTHMSAYDYKMFRKDPGGDFRGTRAVRENHPRGLIGGDHHGD